MVRIRNGRPVEKGNEPVPHLIVFGSAPTRNPRNRPLCSFRLLLLWLGFYRLWARLALHNSLVPGRDYALLPDLGFRVCGLGFGVLWFHGATARFSLIWV